MKVYFNGTIVREVAETMTNESIAQSGLVEKVREILKSEFPNITEATSSVDNGDIYFTVTPKTKGC